MAVEAKVGAPSGACDAALRWGLVCLIVFTPLAFGTVEAWSIAVMEWGIVSLALIYVLGRFGKPTTIVESRARADRRGLLVVMGPVVLFVLFVAAQLVPMPLRWLAAVAPGSASLYSSAASPEAWAPEVPLLAVASRSLPRIAPERAPISVYPARTFDRMLQVATLAVLFAVVALWARRGSRALFTARAAVAVAFVVSIVGLVQMLTWNGRIFWLRRVPGAAESGPRAFGPFVNHDHFAGYIGMVLPVALGVVFSLFERRRTSRSLLQETERGGPAQELSKRALALFAAVMLTVALFFSLSRAGIVTSTVTCSLLLWGLGRRMVSRRQVAGFFAALAVVIVLLVVWIGPGEVERALESMQRLGAEASFHMRVTIWRRVLDGLPNHLWVGAGLGAFEESFASETPSGSAARWDKAHNDYLQLLWETGLVGGALFIAGAALFVRRYWWPALTRWERGYGALGMGLAVALLNIALHSLVDFNLQIGANAFLCALFGGLLVAVRDGAEAGPPESAVPVTGPP